MLWYCLVTKSCPTLCDPMGYSPPVSSVHGFSQAMLEWAAISFSRGSSWPRDQTHVSCKSPALQVDSLPLSHQGFIKHIFFSSNNRHLFFKSSGVQKSKVSITGPKVRCRKNQPLLEAPGENLCLASSQLLELASIPWLRVPPSSLCLCGHMPPPLLRVKSLSASASFFYKTFYFVLGWEGNGNPLQYSCLENPRDRGAWWAAVYGVAQRRTRLRWLSGSSSSSSRGVTD